MSTPTDAHHVPLSTADKLRQDAAAAAEVRALTNHPDVIALRVERVRSQIDAVIWVGILLGLGFTMVNVQQFAAAGAAAWSLPWLAAWLLDPMVSLVLVAVLRAEQVTARYQVDTGPWPHRTKWFAFLATFAMNTWTSWTDLDVAGIVLHSVPPVLVFLAAETAPVLRDRLTEAVMRAAESGFTGVPADPAPPSGDAAEPAAGAETTAELTPAEPEAAPARRPAPRKNGTRKTGGRKGPGRRKLLADYVAEARAAHAPGIEITPAWVRSVTDCARGTSKAVADTLRAELQDAPASTPLPAPRPETETAEPGALTETAARQREAA
ncbi:hypothetical protein BAY59_29215 [Prauserella coralliicola]|nr:hypothetical protein BAY59_29215 [Prauserella coralliicola]